MISSPELYLQEQLRGVPLRKSQTVKDILFTRTTVHFYVPHPYKERKRSDTKRCPGFRWKDPIFYRIAESYIAGGSGIWEVCCIKGGSGSEVVENNFVLGGEKVHTSI